MCQMIKSIAHPEVIWKGGIVMNKTSRKSQFELPYQPLQFFRIAFQMSCCRYGLMCATDSQ